MKTKLRVVAAGVALGAGCATFLASGTASAYQCLGNVFQAPSDGQTNVPTDTRLWVYGLGGASRARLIGPGGEVPTRERFVPIALGGAHGTNFPVLVPERELEPNTRYSIETSYDLGELGGIETETMRFQTGAGPSSGAPPPPQLLSTVAGAAYGPWGGGVDRFLGLEFAHQGILIGDTGAALGDVRGVDDLLLPEGTSFEGLAVNASSHVVRWVTTTSCLTVGLGTCLIWPETAIDRQSARFGVLDLAGNFSGWIDTELELLPPAEATVLADQQRAALEAELAPQPIVHRQTGYGDGHTTGISCTLPVPRNGAPPTSAALALAALLAARRRRAR